jgi:hypothetical protein
VATARPIATNRIRATSVPLPSAATAGMMTNAARSERPSSPSRRTRESRSPFVVFNPKPKTVQRILTCRASMTSCLASIRIL